MRQVLKASVAAVTIPCIALAQPTVAPDTHAASAPAKPAAKTAPDWGKPDKFGITWLPGPIQLAQNAPPPAVAPVPAAPPAAAPAALAPAPGITVLPEVNVIGATPLLGSGVDRYKVPAQNQVFTDRDISLQGEPNALRALQDQAQGVHLVNAFGNPFQPEVLYHGFQASPLQGTPQGLAVYVNGIRFNSPFGDTVNWDLIPDIAIARMNLEGANPVFGLNALGGAISVQLKDGFTYHGTELDIFGGSFGQVGGAFQYGRQIGNTAVYIAAAGMHENGWRDFQSSGLKQFYGDVGWRSERGEVHLSVDAAQNFLQGPGTVPVELLAVDKSAHFTGPDAIANNYGSINLRGSYDINDTTSVQALAYYSNFLQRFANGNGTPFEVCEGGRFLCTEGGERAIDRNGNPVPAFLGPDNDLYGSLASQTTNTNSYGASFQISNTGRVFGLHNHLVAGLSFDGADTLFDGNTAEGGLDLLTRNFFGPGIVLGGDLPPVRARITDAYYGAFFTDTLDLMPKLSVNVAGRFNSAQIDITDLTGGPLTGNHVYNRFNPAVGLTYRLLPAISIYGSYAESNRAPTPAELTCSDPSLPCSLANFFTGDPDLKQVVARTFEVGLRGRLTPFEGGRVNWNLSAFRSNVDDDIIFVTSPIIGTGFFQNIGATRRQGIDAGLRFTSGRWLAWIDYSLTDATFQSPFIESSPNNPGANAKGEISVRPGDRVPGIPLHMLKLGLQYKATDKWTVGATAIAASGQYLFGDEANLNQKLPAYFVVNLNTSYQVTKHVQVFALMQNAFDVTYYNFGTFSETNEVPIVEAPGATNPRAYSIAAPFAVFAGLKITL